MDNAYISKSFRFCLYVMKWWMKFRMNFFMITYSEITKTEFIWENELKITTENYKIITQKTTEVISLIFSSIFLHCSHNLLTIGLIKSFVLRTSHYCSITFKIWISYDIYTATLKWLKAIIGEETYIKYILNMITLNIIFQKYFLLLQLVL